MDLKYWRKPKFLKLSLHFLTQECISRVRGLQGNYILHIIFAECVISNIEPFLYSSQFSSSLTARSSFLPPPPWCPTTPRKPPECPTGIRFQGKASHIRSIFQAHHFIKDSFHSLNPSQSGEKGF